MAVDQFTVDLLKRIEGFSPKAYGDYKQTSIGYGTRAAPGETQISREQAEARLRQEAESVAAYLERVAPNLDPRKKAALVSFGYNLGTGKGGLTDFVSDIQAGNWDSVAARMQRYNHAGGKVNEGLTKRRAEEAALLQGGNSMNDLAQLMAKAGFGGPAGNVAGLATLQPQQPQAQPQLGFLGRLGQAVGAPDSVVKALAPSQGEQQPMSNMPQLAQLSQNAASQGLTSAATANGQMANQSQKVDMAGIANFLKRQKLGV